MNKEEIEAILGELNRIINEPYIEKDHEGNHQTFAKVLRMILLKVI